MASAPMHTLSHQASRQTGYWSGWLAFVAKRISLWQAVARERRHLRQLDDHMLKDLGLMRPDVNRESQRPFWDLSGSDLR